MFTNYKILVRLYTHTHTCTYVTACTHTHTHTFSHIINRAIITYPFTHIYTVKAKSSRMLWNGWLRLDSYTYCQGGRLADHQMGTWLFKDLQNWGSYRLLWVKWRVSFAVKHLFVTVYHYLFGTTCS